MLIEKLPNLDKSKTGNKACLVVQGEIFAARATKNMRHRKIHSN